MAFPNWNFNENSGDDAEAIRQENLRLKAELQQARSMNGVLHNQNQDNVNVLRNNVAPQDSTSDLSGFTWEDVLKEEQKATQQTQISTNKNGNITIKPEQLDSFVDQKIAQQRQKEYQMQVALNQHTVQLQKKFASENPDLLDHQPLVSRLWEASKQLNPTMHPEARYAAVVGEAKAFINQLGYSNKPTNGRSPYGSNPNSPMGAIRNPGGQGEVNLDYDADEHISEIKARQKFIQDRMLS